jgi:serine/threonine protein kinase
VDFDEITILEKIGQGGFGVVYKGMWRGTVVAVKKLIQEEMDEGTYQEFLKEIETMRCALNESDIPSFR